MRRLAALWLAALWLAACGGDEGNGNGEKGGAGAGNGTTPQAGETYPQSAIDAFLEDCKGEPGATDSECECAIREIQADVPYAEYREVDAALREGRDPAPGSQEKINDAVLRCRE